MSDAAAIEGPKSSSLGLLTVRLDRRFLEAALTSASLVFLIISLWGESAGWSPRAVASVSVAGYIAGGWFGLKDAFSSLRARKLDINLLMILAAIGAAIINQWHEGLTLLFLFSLSNTLQTYALDRSARAISSLLKLRPTEATLLTEGGPRRVSIESLRAGDRMLVRPGEMVAADGRIVAGRTDLNQASITGESVPVEKGEGEVVLAGSINGSGAIEVEVSRPASDSTLSQIIRLVEAAQSRKARTQRVLERVEGPYAVVVLGLAAMVAVLPPALGHREFAASFYRAMVLLVVASPCALVISTPASILSAIANGARRGILFKGGSHLERLADVQVVAFDKTGTLTEGVMRVTDIFVSVRCPPDFGESELLALAAALESRSEHPIARAVTHAARERGLKLPDLESFQNLPGRGIHARSNGYLIWIGGERMYREHGEAISPELLERKSELQAQGKTVLVVHRELRREDNVGTHEETGGWLGLLAVADQPRAAARESIRALKQLGVQKIVMLTGDNPVVARGVAERTGVDAYFADLLPEEKVEAIGRLRREYGAVLMVGDGVNDAPALASADVGAAMGAAGSDVALETADLVLMSDAVERVPHAMALSRQARRIIWQNLSFSLLVIGLLVLGAVGFALPLPLGVVGHEGSTLLVVANGLRLLRFQVPRRSAPVPSSRVEGRG
ncbi:MAG: cadmium-translocating P-type ATPase [Planctomycetota bacterium]|nr:MAG: cadmium-translocating P-type ATPase [Planctomycetota bacterium]